MRKLSLPLIGGICGVLALVLTVVNVAGAGNIDHWSDIAGSPFREQINNIGSAGCASGFEDGTFRPRDDVTRQQFAYWMNNCGTRMAINGGSLDISTSGGFTSLATVRLAPGVRDLPTADHGFTMLRADLQVSASAAEAADCPCQIYARLRDKTRGVSDPIALGTLGNAVDESGTVTANLTTADYFIAIPQDVLEYEVLVGVQDAGAPTVNFLGNLTAVYIPFGADGGGALNVPPL